MIKTKEEGEVKEIILGRGAGKTTKLIELAKNKNGYIACFSHREARRIFTQAKKTGFDINKPIIFRDIICRCSIIREKKIWIDELTFLLKAFNEIYGGEEFMKDLSLFQGFKRLARRNRLEILGYTNDLAQE